MDPITLCVTEIMGIMGFQSDKTAREFVKDVRDFVGKDASVPITVFDVCYYLKIKIADYREWTQHGNGPGLAR